MNNEVLYDDMIKSKDNLSMNELLEKGYELVMLFGLFSSLISDKKIKEKSEKGFYKLACSAEELKETMNKFFSEASENKADLFREGTAKLKVRILNEGLNGFDINLTSADSLETAFDYVLKSGEVDLAPFEVFPGSSESGKINPEYCTFFLCTEGGEVPICYNKPFSEYKEISELYYDAQDVVIKAALIFS